MGSSRFLLLLAVSAVHTENSLGLREFFLNRRAFETSVFKSYCESVENEIKCNFVEDNSQHMKVMPINLTLDKLTVIGASAVTIYNQQCCIKKIDLISSHNISTDYDQSDGSNAYELTLDASSAESITSAAITYFKAKNTSIKALELKNVNEFDLEKCIIKTFKADAVALSPSIISSEIGSISLTIGVESTLKIIDSTINEVHEIILRSAKVSSVTNTNINYIKKNGITVTKDAAIRFNSVVFGELEPESFIIEGAVDLQNISYVSNLPLDSVVMRSDSSLSLEYRDSLGNTSMYTITSNSSHFKPFLVILPKERWIIITLAVFLGAAALIIVIIFIIFLKFSKICARDSNSVIKANVVDMDTKGMDNETKRLNEDSKSTSGLSNNMYDDAVTIHNSKKIIVDIPPPTGNTCNINYTENETDGPNENYTENETAEENLEDYSDIDPAVIVIDSGKDPSSKLLHDKVQFLTKPPLTSKPPPLPPYKPTSSIASGNVNPIFPKKITQNTTFAKPDLPPVKRSHPLESQQHSFLARVKNAGMPLVIPNQNATIIRPQLPISQNHPKYPGSYPIPPKIRPDSKTDEEAYESQNEYEEYDENVE